MVDLQVCYTSHIGEYLMARMYPQSDIKLLVALSGNFCAKCKHRCTIDTTDYDASAFVGKISHIYAHSDTGPRANPALTNEQRDCYDNWILLCPTCHDIVDVQPNTYTPDDLIKWKSNHEEWFRKEQEKYITRVTFAELEIVAKAISSTPIQPNTDFTPPDPKIKMERNGLTIHLQFFITLGLAKFYEVSEFISNFTQAYPKFPENLKAGFVAEYNKLTDNGLKGDELFLEMYEFSSGFSNDHILKAAGLAVLCYLFSLCEVFEQ